MGQVLFEIVDKPILVEEVTNKVARREAGAITTFIGTVRELTKGKRTLHLEYEAYKPMAVKQLMRIGEEISERWLDAKVKNYAPCRAARNNGYCGSHCSFITAS